MWEVVGRIDLCLAFDSVTVQPYGPLFKHDASSLLARICLHRHESRCWSQLRHLPPFLHHHGRPPGVPPCGRRPTTAGQAPHVSTLEPQE